MTPEAFLHSIRQQPPPPVCLFLGQEQHQRDRCRRTLVESFLPEQERESGLIRHDLSEMSLAAVLDDARTLSLFSPQRLIWASSAEAAAKEGSSEELASYLQRPTPDVVLVFECSRYEFEGEDKARLERVRKFFQAVPTVVEFKRFQPEAARELARQLAAQARLKISADALDFLAEAVGYEAARIAVEIEKLSLLSAEGSTVGLEEVAQVVPEARAGTIFSLVAALGRGDRMASLQLLDTLTRGGEYLPLALSFLATQFRQALVARDAGLRGPSQIQGYFSKLGTPMWPAKAQQIHQTMSAFSANGLRNALRSAYAADKALRDTRPDDRVVMERFVLEVTGGVKA